MESRIITRPRRSKTFTRFDTRMRVIEPTSVMNTIHELGIQGFDPLGISELGNGSESSTDDDPPVTYQDTLLDRSRQKNVGQVKTLPYWSTSYIARSNADSSQDLNLSKGGICVNDSTRGTMNVVNDSTRGTDQVAVCGGIQGKQNSDRMGAIRDRLSTGKVLQSSTLNLFLVQKLKKRFRLSIREKSFIDKGV